MVLFCAVIIVVLASCLTTETLAQTSQRTDTGGNTWLVTSGYDERLKMRMTPITTPTSPKTTPTSPKTTPTPPKTTPTPRSTTVQPGTDCGRNKLDQTSLHISNGKDAAVGEFPWHAAVFIRDGNKFSQVCGGTLITARLVLSAAHCFVSEATGKLRSEQLYRIALGKHQRSWDEDDTDNRIQRAGVKEIIVAPGYTGRLGKFHHDMAVILLKRALKMTNFVDIICIDWDSSSKSSQLAEGSIGVAAGWGGTATESSSDVLQYAHLPWVSEQVCRAAVDKEQRSPGENYYTADKFCAGFKNRNTSVCRGDSGGGLVFYNDASQSFYLRGVVSVSFVFSPVKGMCSNQLFTGFTDVSAYIRDLIQPALFKQYLS